MDNCELLRNLQILEEERKRTTDQLNVYTQHLNFQQKHENYEPTIAILFGIDGYDDQPLTNVEDSEILKAAMFEANQRLHQYLTLKGMHNECAPTASEWLFSNLPFPIDLRVLTREQQSEILAQLKEKIRNEIGVILFDLTWQNQNGIEELEPDKYNYLFERHRTLSFLGIQDEITSQNIK